MSTSRMVQPKSKTTKVSQKSRGHRREDSDFAFLLTRGYEAWGQDVTRSTLPWAAGLYFIFCRSQHKI